MKTARETAEACVPRCPDCEGLRGHCIVCLGLVDAIESAIVARDAEWTERLHKQLDADDVASGEVNDKLQDHVTELNAANDAWAAKCGALRGTLLIAVSKMRFAVHRGDLGPLREFVTEYDAVRAKENSK